MKSAAEESNGDGPTYDHEMIGRVLRRLLIVEQVARPQRAASRAMNRALKRTSVFASANSAYGGVAGRRQILKSGMWRRRLQPGRPLADFGKRGRQRQAGAPQPFGRVRPQRLARGIADQAGAVGDLG